MPQQDYIGQYGDTLRRLSALDATSGQVAPQPVAAFEQGPTPNPAAFGQRPQQPALAAPAPHSDETPVGIADLWRDMPDEEKENLLKRAKDSGMDIDAEYEAAVAEGQFKPTKKKLTIKDKLGRLAEVALRTASNMGKNTNNNSFADYADAKLATDEKYGALDRADEQNQRVEFERRRAEKLDSNKERRGRAERIVEGGLDRGARSREAAADRDLRREEGEANRQNALDLAKLRAAQEKAGRDTQLFMDSESNVYSIVDGKPVPFEITEAKKRTGKGGRPFVEEVRRQLKGVPKTNDNQLDEDAILRAVAERVKQLNEDVRLKSQLKREGVTDIPAEIQRRATKEVIESARQVKGSAPAAGAAPKRGNAFDQFDSQ